jgi:hypothetical protein
MRPLFILTWLTLAAPAAANMPPPPREPVVLPEVVEVAVKAAQDAMRAELLAASPKARVEVRREDGPYGTVIAVAVIPDAYPGTGVRRRVVDATTGVTYGKGGTRAFADFARERGWLTTPPSTDALVRFVNTALFDGVAILDTRDPAPRVERRDDGLVIEVVRRYMPSHAGERLVITVPKAGPETVTRAPLEP